MKGCIYIRSTWLFSANSVFQESLVILISKCPIRNLFDLFVEGRGEGTHSAQGTPSPVQGRARRAQAAWTCGGARRAGGVVERGGLRGVFSACVQRGRAGRESGVTSVMRVG